MRSRLKGRNLEDNSPLHDIVADGLALEWSPRQIAERLFLDHPDDHSMRAFTWVATADQILERVAVLDCDFRKLVANNS